MNTIIYSIIETLRQIVTKEAIVFLISLLPTLELRGGMIAGALLKIPYKLTLLLCLLGNLLPIPFILFFLNKLLLLMEKWSWSSKIALWLKNKANKNKKLIEKYGFLGLILFVAIPLPGSGAWTGALVATVLRMDIKKASIAIILGVLIASAIMSVLSYGVISNIIK